MPTVTRNMLQIEGSPATEPFPHLVIDGVLPDDVYSRLADSFPNCPPGSGPTGFTLFRGDAEYDAFMSANPLWRDLAGEVQDQRFADRLLALFSDAFAESRLAGTQPRIVDHVESRADKERVVPEETTGAPENLWVRFDIMQGRIGYTRGAHLDHRRRAATLLLYMSDPDEDGIEGGELLLHPGPDAAASVAVRPRHNRAVAFACSNSSWHSVRPITRQAGPRNFVQISLSSSVDLWPTRESAPAPTRRWWPFGRR